MTSSSTPNSRWSNGSRRTATTSRYFTDVDADRYGSLIENHQIWMDAGHDEYWSGNEFNNVMAARNAGVDLAFFSGNTAFWKTYYSTSIDGSNTR